MDCINRYLLTVELRGCVAGKTAAFMVPTLERLMYCDTRSQPVTRVLVLVPTRELAIQIYEESRKLAQFTDITVCLSAGICHFISDSYVL